MSEKMMEKLYDEYCENRATVIFFFFCEKSLDIS